MCGCKSSGGTDLYMPNVGVLVTSALGFTIRMTMSRRSSEPAPQHTFSGFTPDGQYGTQREKRQLYVRGRE